MTSSPATTSWPSLRVSDWTATRDTLHMWAQIVGKTGWPTRRWSTAGGR